MKFYYIELTNGETAQAFYQINALSESIKKNFTFKELTNNKIAKAVAFVDLEKNIINL